MVELALIVVIIALQSSGRGAARAGRWAAACFDAAGSDASASNGTSGDGLGAIGDLLWPAGSFARAPDDHRCKFRLVRKIDAGRKMGRFLSCPGWWPNGHSAGEGGRRRACVQPPNEEAVTQPASLALGRSDGRLAGHGIVAPFCGSRAHKGLYHRRPPPMVDLHLSNS